jgi:flagellar M-ring protein FliF
MSDPLTRALSGMNGSRRFMVLAAAAALAAALWAVSRWASTPTYTMLYQDLELGEAGRIAEKLGKVGLGHRLANGGTAIEVPVTDAARARVALAKDGLPSVGRPGLELFDKPSWAMTDFTQRVTLQRALEGELSRTIGGLRGIQRAQVHLVLPVSSPLRRNDRPASASVVLTLQQGVVLASDAVQGITYIVSNSVEQLASENVAVMDDAGRVLSIPANGGPTGMTSRQLEIQRSVEDYLGGKIEELLGTVVGVGHARAKVSARLSFDQIDRTVDSFDPDGQVIETEQRSETGGGEGAGSQTVVSNGYQNSRRLERIVGSVGNVSHLTVAVVVDQKSLRPVAEGGVDLARLDAMVRDAVGADSARGDRVSVAAVPFEIPVATPGAGTEVPRADPVQVAERFSRPTVGVVAIVAILLIAWRVIGTFGRGAGASAPAPIAGTTEPVTNGGGDGVSRNRLRAEANAQPEAAAQVARAWLAEGS